MQPYAFPIKASSLHKLPRGWTSHCIIFVQKRKLQSIKHDIRFSFWKNFEDISIILHRYCYLNSYEHRTHVSLRQSLYWLQVRDWESCFNQTVNAFKVLLNMMLLNIQTIKKCFNYFWSLPEQNLFAISMNMF